MENFYKLGEKTDTQEIVDFFNDRFDDFAFSMTPKIYLQANLKMKKALIKISKIPDQYQEEMKADILVQINTDYFDDFISNNDVDNLNQILFDQEIDKINIDGKSGKITIKSRALNASKGIIDKYSFDDVARAEEIVTLYDQQKKDNA